MDTKAARQRIRKEWEEEAREDRQQEEQIESLVKKWKRATVCIGVFFLTTCAAVVPFLAGHSFHRLWDSVGKNVLVLAMVLFVAFVYVCAHYVIFWNYLKNVRKANQKFAPPHIRYNKS
jgi:nicotinamide riboside transporter PnuC